MGGTRLALAVRAARAVASSLLDFRRPRGADGATPWVGSFLLVLDSATPFCDFLSDGFVPCP